MAYDTKGGFIGTTGRQSLQGATFGFSDEIIDALGTSGAIAYAKAFQPELLPEITMKAARQSSSQDLARDWENAPVTSFASQAAGSIPLGLTKAAGNVANWASSGTKLKAAAKGAAVGAGYGGISGVGAGEDSLSDRAKSGISGAALGAFLGAAMSPLSRMGKSPVTPPDQSAIAKESVKQVPKGASKAQKMMAEMLAKRPDIADQLARAEAMDTAAKKTGVNLTLAEKLAQSQSESLLPMQAKVGANPQTAGMMEQFYANRSGTKEQAGQIENALMNQVRQLSPETQNYDDVAQALINRASKSKQDITKKLVTEARPFYQAAEGVDLTTTTRTPYKVNVESPEILSDPLVQSVVKKVMNDPIYKGELLGGNFGKSSVKVLDLTRRVLDDMATEAKNAGELNKYRLISNKRESLQNALVSASPDYAKGVSIYSGQPDQLLMRQQAGSLADIDPMQAKQVANALFSGTQQNAEMASRTLGAEGSKQAAAARLLNVMDTARGEPQTWASKIAPDQRTTDMLRTYVGGNQLDDTLNVINQAKIGDRYRYGSPTEPLQSAGNALEGAANAGLDLVTGNKIGLLRKAAGMLGVKNPEDNPAFYQEMADLMTTDSGMDLLRQVASGNQNAVQKLQSGSLMKRGMMTASPLLNQNPVTRAAIGGVTAPAIQQEQITQQPSYDPYNDPELTKIMRGGQNSYDPYKDPELMNILRSK